MKCLLYRHLPLFCQVQVYNTNIPIFRSREKVCGIQNIKWRGLISFLVSSILTTCLWPFSAAQERAVRLYLSTELELTMFGLMVIFGNLIFILQARFIIPIRFCVSAGLILDSSQHNSSPTTPARPCLAAKVSSVSLPESWESIPITPLSIKELTSLCIPREAVPCNPVKPSEEHSIYHGQQSLADRKILAYTWGRYWTSNAHARYLTDFVSFFVAWNPQWQEVYSAKGSINGVIARDGARCFTQSMLR